jgi:predicted TIM-barrel fold metal-dependent hydrolase
MSRRVDVHHHFLPAEYLAAVGADRLGAATAEGTLLGWSVERSLELMDVGGIQTTIASTPSPNYAIGDLQATQKLARSCNEAMAQVVRDRPNRFGMFASLILLPGMDMDKALREIEYCYDVLGADGVGLRSNYAGKHLGEPYYDPLWQELDRRGGVVHVHPALAPGTEGLPGISNSTLEYPFDTTRTMVSLIYHGTPKRFPRVRFIFSHAGGTMPYLAGRVASFSALNPRFAQKGREGAIPALQDFYYDVTDSVNPWTFKALLELVPKERILFGSDVPFASSKRLGASVETLAGLGLDEAVMRAIDRDNAARLFPRVSMH